MKKKHRLYTIEVFKQLLNIEGDIYNIKFDEYGIHIHTLNEGVECVEGALVYAEEVSTISHKINKNEMDSTL